MEDQQQKSSDWWEKNISQNPTSWYQEVQLDSLELTTTRDGQKMRLNPSAPPISARYYEIGINAPIFPDCNSNVVSYDFAELENGKPQKLPVRCMNYTT